jgi:hypothetical protein
MTPYLDSLSWPAAAVIATIVVINGVLVYTIAKSALSKAAPGELIQVLRELVKLVQLRRWR